MRFHKHILAVFLLLMPLAAAGEQDMTFPTAPLSISTHEKTLKFTVEVATTFEQQQHGLMFRKTLPDMHGMIFVFPAPMKVAFWMKNTPLPLDMLFVDSKGIVSQIKANAAPESTDLIASSEKVRAVLELQGGSASKLGIARGDKVIYPIFP